MGYTDALKRMDNDKLLDVVKNYRRYGYDEETRDTAILILEERGWSSEELKMFGYLDNWNYDEAERQYNAYCRNSKIGFAILILSLGMLFIFYFIFMYLAFLNQQKFYKALGKEDESNMNADMFWSVMLYFHLRNRMREQLKGIS